MEFQRPHISKEEEEAIKKYADENFRNVFILGRRITFFSNMRMMKVRRNFKAARAQVIAARIVAKLPTLDSDPEYVKLMAEVNPMLRVNDNTNAARLLLSETVRMEREAGMLESMLVPE